MTSPGGALHVQIRKVDCMKQTTGAASSMTFVANSSPCTHHRPCDQWAKYWNTMSVKHNSDSCSMWWPFRWESAHFSHKGPESKYFQLCEPDHYWCKLFHSAPEHRGSHRQCRSQGFPALTSTAQQNFPQGQEKPVTYWAPEARVPRLRDWIFNYLILMSANVNRHACLVATVLTGTALDDQPANFTSFKNQKGKWVHF